LLPSNRAQSTLCAAWLGLVRSGELRQWMVCRGGFMQHASDEQLMCSLEDERRVRLLHATHAAARRIVTGLGIDTSTLQIAAVKHIRMQKGKGEQEPHMDIPDYELAQRCITINFFLTDTISTALPIHPMAMLRPAFTAGEKLPTAAALKLVQRSQFRVERVKAGSCSVIRGNVIHYGPANPDEEDREVVFICLSPRDVPAPDTDRQRYPHGVVD
jgi:hypothetical protein